MAAAFGLRAVAAYAGDPGTGWCLKTDVNADRFRTSTDIELFTAGLLEGAGTAQVLCAADMDGDLVLSGNDIPEFIRIYLEPDGDGDSIPDVFETNDGAFASATATGTDPTNPDTDGDALRDGDEVYDAAAGLDLHVLGCSPVRKNLLIEVDWFDDSEGTVHTHRPSLPVINLITAAFAAAPVPNPYGAANGITMIIDYRQGGALSGGNLIPGSDTVVSFDSEFNAYKAANFAANRNGFFHYAIFCHRYNSSTNNSSGVAELNGDDFIVSLQTSQSSSSISKTMMHELGHNLNLRHGGFENLNYKPNYNSVMNYRFQFPGADSNASCNAVGDSILDYSRGLRLPLDEGNLDESQGVCGTVAIDWNGDSAISAGVAMNINCSAGQRFTCGSSNPDICGDASCSLLLDFNDWAAVSFSGIFQADLAAPEIIACQDVPFVQD